METLTAVPVAGQARIEITTNHPTEFVDLTERANRGRDYLDWFEITRARETSGAFDDYLKLKEDLKDRKRNREDGLSDYLDRMDKVFDRSAD